MSKQLTVDGERLVTELVDMLGQVKLHKEFTGFPDPKGLLTFTYQGTRYKVTIEIEDPECP